MTRATTPLAVAADYADALMTARRAKNLLFLLLLLIILIQPTLFFLAKYDVIEVGSPDVAATTQPTARVDLEKVVPYVVPLLNFGGVAFSIIMTIVMLLLVTIMLVGRLIGVSSVTGAFIWGILLVVLLMPWQTLFITDGDYPVAGSSASVEQPAFKWPGALYTYAELKNHHDDRFDNVWPDQVWYWGRYAGLPALALLVLLIVQIKSGRGLRYALGEADVHVEVTSRQDMSVMS